MSRQLAFDTICLKPTPRLGHTEYSMNYHDQYIGKVTGLPAGAAGRMDRFHDLWKIDFLWSVNDGLHGNWAERGRCMDMGHAVYAADGSDERAAIACPFTTPEEVWAFDPVAEYGLPEFAEQVAAYQRWYEASQGASPEQLVTGGYYKSVVSGAIQAFGWDMLLLAASEADKFERVLDGFFRFTLHHMRAWAQTTVEAVIQHDDFVWTAGPFMNPDFYRQAIIPRYAELWKPLKAAGKKVLFCSDGTFLEFMDDIVAAGADGLIFEPSNDFAAVVDRFGASHCLVGSAVDCRTMTFADWPAVQAEMDRTFALAERCRGLIFAVGNHIPANVSDDMCDRFIAHFLAHCGRRA